MINKKLSLYALVLFFLLIGAIAIYLISPTYVDFFYIDIALLFALISITVLMLVRKNTGLKGRPFSLTVIFIMSYVIVIFQLPFDFTFSSFSDNYLYSSVVFDERVLTKSIWYSVIFLISIFLGIVFQTMRYENKLISIPIYKKVNTKIFFLLFYAFFILHLLTIDKGYYLGQGAAELRGMGGSVPGIAGSILNYFVMLQPICFGLVLYNYKLIQNKPVLSVRNYLNLFPLPFILIILLFSFFTFLSGDRGPAIRSLIVLVFGYYIFSDRKVSYLKFVAMIVVAGLFLSTIKLIGEINFKENLVDAFIGAYERLGSSHRMESISPYTLELAGSFRAYNTAFSLWYSGYSLHGASLFTGTLMSIPYGVSLIMTTLNLEHIDINTAFFITSYVGESYGLGTSLIGDALLNVGFITSIIIAFIIGVVITKIDYAFYIKVSSVYSYTIGLYFLMNSLGLTRGSIFPMIGGSLFIFMAVFLIKRLGIKLSKLKKN